MNSGRPVHLQVRFLCVVVLGGMVGVAAREGLILATPETEVPWVIFGINVVGAFILGFLLDALARTGPDTGVRRMVRLGCGTGILGGFTTYSALATDTARLTSEGSAWGVGYAVLSLVVGLVAALVGMRVATSVRPGRGDVEVEA